MITEYKLYDLNIKVVSDIASEFPIYIYLAETKDYLLYSNSMAELLTHKKLLLPLEIRRESISFLLQSSIVPLPNTIYKNIFIVGIGDVAEVVTVNHKVEIRFRHTFPFMNNTRGEELVSESKILELLTVATVSSMKGEKASYLFHSAGKDSNMIALALAEAGYQDKVTCLTHKSQGIYDESLISQKIAKRLGFKHKKLYEPSNLDRIDMDNIHYYFENIPFPCVDNVTLAYPLYAKQVEFTDSNIIDGSGNDVFIGHIPSKKEFLRQNFFSKLHFLRPYTNFLNSNRVHKVFSTKSEWSGLNGLSFGNTNKILKGAIDVYSYWKNSDKIHKDWDYFDLRANIWGCMVESDRVIRKSRNLAHIYNANIILPWTNVNVVEYFSKLPVKSLFNRNSFQNKLILRKILKEKIGLDSDKLGKMAYTFDFFSVLMLMKNEVIDEILGCNLWNKEEMEKVFHNLYETSQYNVKDKILLQRIYLISIWYNRNKYI